MAHAAHAVESITVPCKCLAVRAVAHIAVPIHHSFRPWPTVNDRYIRKTEEEREKKIVYLRHADAHPAVFEWDAGNECYRLTYGTTTATWIGICRLRV